MSSNSSNSTGIQVNLRGLQGNGRVNTMIDGSRQSSNTYRGYAGTRDNTYLDPDLIGGIDIKKGVDAGPYSGN
ncbi:TonB-dependent receptor plug domain-containing protein [Tatumella citrea]|uniref:TonB-dependent receptor plug domain-containing protein n=1 Tax=Tatumella citrea TaxID=53336 RepID=UPI00389B35CD